MLTENQELNTLHYFVLSLELFEQTGCFDCFDLVGVILDTGTYNSFQSTVLDLRRLQGYYNLTYLLFRSEHVLPEPIHISKHIQNHNWQTQDAEDDNVSHLLG